jgi:hypothetical protein
MREDSGHRIEVLIFEGCPNAGRARALVDRVCEALGLEPEVETVVVPDLAAARKHRFLGSPTIRVDGHDIDPHAQSQGDYVLSCRVYETSDGLSGLPDEAWLHDALSPSAR